MISLDNLCLWCYHRMHKVMKETACAFRGYREDGRRLKAVPKSAHRAPLPSRSTERKISAPDPCPLPHDLSETAGWNRVIFCTPVPE